MRYIVEVFSIHLEASKGAIGSLEEAQVLFELASLAGFTGQAVLAQDTGDSAHRRLQGKVIFKSAGAKTRGCLPGGHHKGYLLSSSFMGTMVRGAAFIAQSRKGAGLLKPPAPAAHRITRAAIFPGGGADTILLGFPHQRPAGLQFSIFTSHHSQIPHSWGSPFWVKHYT